MDHSPDLSFYDTVAEVIPVLFLALVFEARVFFRVRQDRQGLGSGVQYLGLTIFFLLVLTSGEIAALWAAANGSGGGGADAAILLSVSLGLGLLCARIVGDLIVALEEEMPGWIRVNRQWVAAAVALFIGAGTVLAIGDPLAVDLPLFF